MVPKGKDTVEYKDWNVQFLHVYLDLCNYLAKDQVLSDSIGPYEVKYVLSGQGQVCESKMSSSRVWNIWKSREDSLRKFVPD